jgi:menaquinone-dependent protoporphyrinogen IX oxidase
MKVLIVYSTKNGVSRRACEMLAKRLEGNATIEMYDVKDNPPSPLNMTSPSSADQ